MSQTPSYPIPLNTLLGERYKVTASAVETADGDAVLEGKDQVLNRKVSIVVSSPAHNERLITNARTMATNSRSSIQVLDLGNTAGRTYLVTSHARPDALLDNLLTDSSVLAASAETQEALGQELFGEETRTGQTTRVAPVVDPVAPASISATREVASDSTAAVAGVAAEVPQAEVYESYDEYPDEADFDEEDDRRRGGAWIVAIAAVIVLVIGVAAVFANLNGMVDKEASQEAFGQNSASASATASASAKASAAPSASASATATKRAAAKLTGTPTRIIGGTNTTFMADMDSILPQLTDGNTATQWMSSGFGSANFGGAIESFALAFQLQDQTVVKQLKIEQVSGTGGAFTVYGSDSASLADAEELGSGTFDAETVTVNLSEKAQGKGVKYIIVQFTEAPYLSQPIVAGYPYGTRISEVSVSN